MSSPASTRSNNFNLLRLVFATLVILAHTPEILDGSRIREPLTQLFGTISFGGFAVDSFFLLSGYLIVKSWIRQPSLFNFMKNRILRIYPGFIVASLVCAFAVAPMAAAPSYFAEFDVMRFIKGMATLSPPMIPDTFEGTHYPITNGSMWTIRHEFICYLLVALVGLVGGFRYKHSWMAITALFTLAVLLNGSVLPDHFQHPIFRLGMMFTVGGLYFLYCRTRLNDPRFMIGAAIVLVPCMFSLLTVDFAMAYCWGYIIISFAERHSPRLAGFNVLPDISYGVYLYAWPTTKLLIWFAPTISLLPLLLLTTVTSLLLGTISWYLVEKPFMILKDKLPARLSAMAPGIGNKLPPM